MKRKSIFFVHLFTVTQRKDDSKSEQANIEKKRGEKRKPHIMFYSRLTATIYEIQTKNRFNQRFGSAASTVFAITLPLPTVIISLADRKRVTAPKTLLLTTLLCV